MTLPIYFDYNATTPIAPEVRDAMRPWLGGVGYGNPSSGHWYAGQARAAVAQARSQVAVLIGADPGEVLFTGSATEANNLAVLGVAAALKGRGQHFVTSAVEHPAVSAPMGVHRKDSRATIATPPARWRGC